MSKVDTEKNAKKPLVGSVGELDVVVVVGGQEFLENSGHLCYWSRYFEAAMRSGMKEAQTKRFEFPDRCPEEWELLMKILDPFDDTAKVDMDNFETVLSWSNELLIPKLMAECDKVLAEFMGDPNIWLHSIPQFVGLIATAFDNGLQISIPKGIKYAKAMLKFFPHFLALHQLTILTNLCFEYKEKQNGLWDELKLHLPPSIAESPTIVGNELVPILIHTSIQQKEERRLHDKTRQIVKDFDGNSTVEALRTKLKGYL